MKSFIISVGKYQIMCLSISPAGTYQVLIGIVPGLCAVYPQQSAKSVYPLATDNCKENRYIIVNNSNHLRISILNSNLQDI